MFSKEYLKKVLSVQSKSYKDEEMLEFLEQELNAIPGLDIYQDTYGNIYVTKGIAEIYPCAVSHIDTVHSFAKGFTVVEIDGVFMAWDSYKREQVGVGGDDKVGVYVCLQLLNDLDNVKVAFFRDEEVGCIGSGQADMDFFNNVSFVLQADRREYGDFIQHSNGCDLQSEEFQKTIEPILDNFGYSLAYGTITDVGELKSKGLEVCCANVSCGYYHAHSIEEFVVIEEAEMCYELFVTLFNSIGDKKWEHVYEEPDWRNQYWQGGGSHGGWWKKKEENTWEDLEKDAEKNISYPTYARAKAKVENSFSYAGFCPECGDYSDYYDCHNGMDAICGSCCGMIEIDRIDIVEDYERIIRRYEEKASTETWCSCHGGHVDPITHEMDCKLCKLENVT